MRKVPDDLAQKVKEGLEARKHDADDRRCLQGKYAPKSGVCCVCGGEVAANIRFDHSGLIGGPPARAHVADFSCRSCGIVYKFAPSGRP